MVCADSFNARKLKKDIIGYKECNVKDPLEDEYSLPRTEDNEELVMQEKDEYMKRLKNAIVIWGKPEVPKLFAMS